MCLYIASFLNYIKFLINYLKVMQVPVTDYNNQRHSLQCSINKLVFLYEYSFLLITIFINNHTEFIKTS